MPQGGYHSSILMELGILCKNLTEYRCILSDTGGNEKSEVFLSKPLSLSHIYQLK
jgi:hypothetical protein